MSKDNNTAGKNDDKQEEEFIAVEVDSSGKPLNSQQEAEDHDEDEDHDDDAEDLEDSDRDADERLGHEEGDQDEDETPEQKRERRRREQRAKRVRNRVAAEAKDRLIQNQGRMLLNLQEQVAQLQGRTVQYDVNLLQTQLQAIEDQQRDAKTVLAKLGKAGDHEGIAEVVEVQMNLRDQHRQTTEQLKRAKVQASKKGKAAADDDSADDIVQPSARRAPAPDPRVIEKAQQWTGQHRWAHPRHGDPEEAEIVKAIDHHLAQEGWDPKSDDYWDELTARVRKRLPHRFKKAAPNGDGRNGGRRVSDDNGGRRPAQGGPRMAPASQSSGSSRPLGKNEVRVTPERKKAMQEAGMWDDTKKRNKMLAQYAKYDRENAGQ